MKQQAQGMAGSNNIETPMSSHWPRKQTEVLPLPFPLSNSSSLLSGAESFQDYTLDSSPSLSQSSTLPRILDGREYDAQRIDNCFTL